MKIENEYFAITLSESLKLEVQDKVNQSNWSTKELFRITYGNCNYLTKEHGCVHTEKTPNEIHIKFDRIVYQVRYQYCRPDPGPDLRFHFIIRLEGDHIIFKTNPIEGMDDEECEVMFPDKLFRFNSREIIQCPLPLGYGALLRFPETEKNSIRIGGAINMPILGILPEKQGGAALYFKDYCDMAGSLEINQISKNETFLDLRYLFHQKISNYSRELHLYGMPCQSDYNRLAKWYRSIVQQEKRFVTLKEKIANSPDVEKLVGTVVWKHNVYSMKKPPVEHNYSYFVVKPEEAVYEKQSGNWSAYEVFDTAKEHGFDRVCIYNMGWNRGGFDNMYPTRLPPNPERGTVEEFSKAAEYGRSLSPGYIYSVHDNYYECYKSSSEFDPHEMAYDVDGKMKRGGIWRGGRSALLCSSFAMKYVKRDIPQIYEMLGKGSIYIDVSGSAPPVSCAHPEHIVGEVQDQENRREIFTYIKSVMGSLAVEQQPRDFCVDIVDMGAFGPLTEVYEITVKPTCLVPIPLWQLVYHDVVLNYMAESSLYGAYGDEYINFVALYGMLPTAFDENCKRISYGLREAYLAEMVEHEFLTPPRLNEEKNLQAVARTLFADGTEVVANFNCDTFSWRGKEVKKNQFILIQKGDI